MKIYFKEIEYKNILSYGNALTTVGIDNGLTALVGKNGHGKSVLLDALAYCLFGKPYRDIKMDELINRRNKKELLVTCSFTVDNSISYSITRGMKPDVLILKKDDTELDLLSTKKLNQVEIDKILGIDYDLFKQIISLSINHNKPFLAISTPKKREIIEQIFNVSIICDMVKVVKKDNSDLRISIEMLTRVVSVEKASLNAMKDQLENIQVAEKLFNTQKKTNLQQHNEKLLQTEDSIAKCQKNIETCESLIKTLELADISHLKDEESKFRTKQAELRGKGVFSQKLLKNLESYDVCPTCNNDLTGEHKKTEIAVHTAILRDCSTKINNMQEKIVLLQEKIQNQENVDTQRKRAEYDLKVLGVELGSMTDRKNDVEDSIRQITDSKFEIDVSGIQETYTKKYADAKVTYKQLKDKQAEFGINDSVLQVLSETGIKAYIFKKIVPVLNNIINQYLKYFGLDAEVTFNELMEETILDLRHQSKKVSYESFSEGEKKRIDMAILLSFLKITKSLANWNCNLLVVDELLDSSVDEEGLEKLLDSLKTISKDSKNLAIMLISHRIQQGLVSRFDKILSIEKGTHGFSTLKVKEV